MKSMMFARTFPMTHPRKGEPTYFVEKIYNSFNMKLRGIEFFSTFEDDLERLNPEVRYGLLSDFRRSITCRHGLDPKGHTIRAGNRWKVGDFFTPRVWSGRPYNRKTIIFAPPIEVKKTWDIEIDACGVIAINGYYDYSDMVCSEEFPELLAKNDGLSLVDFHDWFPIGKDFLGQIICWNQNIEY